MWCGVPGICTLATGPICGPAAPICRTALCPLVNPILERACTKVVDWLLAKLEDSMWL